MQLASGYTRVKVHIERYPAEAAVSCHVFAVDRHDQVTWCDSFPVGPFDTVSEVVAHAVRVLRHHGVLTV